VHTLSVQQSKHAFPRKKWETLRFPRDFPEITVWFAAFSVFIPTKNPLVPS
jgi:hypothetical protein